MSEEKKYYCFCSSNCRYETLTKEQILAAIAQATGAVNVDPNAGFITKVKEKNGGNYVTFWVGTTAQYNAITQKDTNCVYILTDDTTNADLRKAVEQMAEDSRKAAEQMEKTACYIVEEKTYKDDSGETYFILRKYSDGTAECYHYWEIPNVQLTEEKGGFYAMAGGAARLPISEALGLTKPPKMVTISVDSVFVGADIVSPNAFVMQGGAKSADKTPNFVIIADAPAAAATVRLVVHIVWDWEVK